MPKNDAIIFLFFIFFVFSHINQVTFKRATINMSRGTGEEMNRKLRCARGMYSISRWKPHTCVPSTVDELVCLCGLADKRHRTDCKRFTVEDIMLPERNNEIQLMPVCSGCDAVEWAHTDYEKVPLEECLIIKEAGMAGLGFVADYDYLRECLCRKCALLNLLDRTNKNDSKPIAAEW